MSLILEVMEIDGKQVLVDFVQMGGDSLSAVRLKARLQDEFHVDVPMEILFQEDTINRVVDYIHNPLDLSLPNINFEREYELPEDFVVEPLTDPMKPRKIFLTGCTGFLGAFLLRVGQSEFVTITLGIAPILRRF